MERYVRRRRVHRTRYPAVSAGTTAGVKVSESTSTGRKCHIHFSALYRVQTIKGTTLAPPFVFEITGLLPWLPVLSRCRNDCWELCRNI